MRKLSMELRWGELVQTFQHFANFPWKSSSSAIQFFTTKEWLPEKSLVKWKLWCYFSRKGVASKSFSRLPSQLCHYIWRLLDMVANFTFRDNLSATHVPDTLVELWLYMWPSFNSATPKSCVAFAGYHVSWTTTNWTWQIRQFFRNNSDKFYLFTTSPQQPNLLRPNYLLHLLEEWTGAACNS